MRMTPHVAPRPSNSSVASQVRNSAPVLDFRCLFTRDLYRKHKRWQDGRLKFHTFNKRIIVHDETSNFVGDSHWQEDGDLEEGRELSLERNGVLVEVGEYLGKRDQNLDELLDKRIKEREKRAASKIASGPTKFPIQSNPNQFNHLRSRALDVMLASSKSCGTPLLLNSSALKERPGFLTVPQKVNEYDDPAKRRKLDISPVKRTDQIRNIFGRRDILSSFKSPEKVLTASEPGTVKPVLERSSPATIDLTIDLENPILIDSEPKGKDADDSVERKTRTQRKIHPNHTTKPKTGYANNLMGTSLTLSTPHKKFSQKLGNVGNKTMPASIRNPRYAESSNSPGENSNFGNSQTENLIRQQASRTIEPIEISISTSRSSPKCARRNTLRSVPELSKQSIGLSSHRSPSPAINSTSFCSKPKLRIKSKPPRKMLSLGALLTHTPNQDRVLVKKKHFSNFSKLDDHATRTESNTIHDFGSLISSCKNNSILDVIRNRSETNLNDLASSLRVSEVNSRKTYQSPSDRTSKLQSKHRQEVSTTDIFKATHKKSKELSESELRRYAGDSPERISPIDNFSVFFEKTNSPISHSLLDESQVVQQDFADETMHSIVNNSPADEVKKDLRMDIKNKSSRAVSTTGTLYNEKKAEPYVTSLPYGGMQATTSRFRAMINRIGKASKKFEDKVPSQPGKPERVDVQPEQTPTPSEEDRVVSDIENLSPMPSPTIIPSSQKIHDEIDAVVPQRDIIDSRINLATNNKNSILQRKPKVILANPATRGISLLTIAASTVDALNPNNFTPLSSSPLEGGMIEPISEIDDPIVTASSSLEAKKTLSTGPWSRESFDLLGDIKLPGR